MKIKWSNHAKEECKKEGVSEADANQIIEHGVEVIDDVFEKKYRIIGYVGAKYYVAIVTKSKEKLKVTTFYKASDYDIWYFKNQRRK